MASLFQPGDAKSKRTTVSSPSAAAQALAEFRAKILGGLLDSASGSRPTFKDFVGGAALPSRLPGGLSAGLPALLQAMSQPHAFDSTQTTTGTDRPPTPSVFSDLSQLGILGALLYNSGALGAGADGVGKILSMIGGAKGIGGVNPALGDTTGNTYGSNADLIPGGNAGAVPSNYPGLLADGGGTGGMSESDLSTLADLLNVTSLFA